MQNKTKKKKLPTSPYRAVLEKHQHPANYTVCILKVQTKGRRVVGTQAIRRYHLGAVTRQEAAEARRNFLTLFLMEIQEVEERR